jgi:hypothetical protein
MSVERAPAPSRMPCVWQPASTCEDCPIEGCLMCHYDAHDTRNFFMNALPFMVTAVVGAISGGYGWHLLLWVAYSLLFFFVWEARVLCSRCPMWAEESRVLHCHANYGVVKLWKYRPGPMSRSEQAQFLAGVLLWVGFPLVLALLGGQYLFALIGVVAVASGAYGVRQTACSRCLNFSCPGNTVPKEVVDAFLHRNPEERAAWEASGYRLGE